MIARIFRSVLLSIATASLGFSFPAAAQPIKNPPQPQPVPLPAPLPAPVDKPYPGTIQLEVDAANTVDHVLHVRERIPVDRGAKEMVVLYPEWIPGDHSPTGPISRVSGVFTQVDGKRVQWVRDQIQVFAFHIPLTPGAKSVEVEFDYLSPVRHDEGRIEMSDAILDLAWDEVLLYPAGYFSRDIPYDVSVKLPEGWKHATALEPDSEQGAMVRFKQTMLNTLVDSPLYAGSHFKRIDLSPSATDTVHLDVFADEDKDLAITPEELEQHKKLAMEADKLYGSHHYQHYDLLLLVSDKVGGIGLEHHQSSENGQKANYFTDWDAQTFECDLLGHEYTHSWNGKFRRPADLWTPDFNMPMRDDLLWVYEGMTQYWGNVLTARAGMRTQEQSRDLIARVASYFESAPGRKWRPLVDTTNEPTISQRRPVGYMSWQLGEDYYTEGQLIWLDTDTKIRELTKGQKSLDDFAKAFLGVYNGSFVTLPYTFEDVVNTLNGVVAYDWAKFLRERVYELHPAVPEDGITRGGYKLVYTDTLPDWAKRGESVYGLANFSTSLGFAVNIPKEGGNPDEDGPSGGVAEVWWDSPAFKAGVTSDMQLVSVNGQEFSADVLRDAILKAEQTKQPLQLQFKQGKQYTTIALPYYGGLRVPSLQRVEGTPDRLDEILAPSKSPLPAF